MLLDHAIPSRQLSQVPKVATTKHGKLLHNHFNFNVATYSNRSFSLPPEKMLSLLHIASRVEAAVNSYVSVRDTADSTEWKHQFNQEKVSAVSRYGYCRLNPPFDLG
jgi:hypothetical protein